MDRTWSHYSLPPRVDFCRVEEVDPALVGDSHQLLRHLTRTRRRSLPSVYKYEQSCTSKGSGGYSPKKLKLNKCVFRDVHQWNRISCRSAWVVYLMDRFDPLYFWRPVWKRQLHYDKWIFELAACLCLRDRNETSPVGHSSTSKARSRRRLVTVIWPQQSH